MKFLKGFISLLLSLLFVLQLLPMQYLGVKTIQAFALEHYEVPETYNFEIPQETDNTIYAKTPPTFILADDNLINREYCNAFQEELSSDEKEYWEIIHKEKYFSNLTEGEKHFLCNYSALSLTYFELLESRGFSINDSLNLSSLAQDSYNSIEKIINMNLSIDEMYDRLNELYKYIGCIRENFVGTENDILLRNCFSYGYSFEQIINAYGISKVFQKDINILLEENIDIIDAFNQIKSDNIFVESDGTIFFSENENSLNLSFDDSPSTIKEESEDNIEIHLDDDVVEDTTELTVESNNVSEESVEFEDSENISKNVHLKSLNDGDTDFYSDNYLNETTINNTTEIIIENNDFFFEDVTFENIEKSHKLITDEINRAIENYYSVAEIENNRQYDSLDFLGAPYILNRSENENVNLNTGELVYSHIDYRIPGRNGLDLVIERRYSSQKSNYYIPKGYITYTDGEESYYNSGEENYFSRKMYALGNGWTLAFSSISITNDGKYLHLADGRTYSVSETNEIEGYALNDITFSTCDETFYGVDVPAAYKITYQNGKEEYFSQDGRLICIEDKYGCNITFNNSIVNDLPYIEITDTLNNKIIISGEKTESGQIMTVSLPNNISMSYEVESYGNDYSQALAKYTDAEGNITNYSYNVEKTYFDVYGQLLDGENYYVNLTTITHPTNAQTKYEYTPELIYLGTDGGTMYVFRVKSRKDCVGESEYNSTQYTYFRDYTGEGVLASPGNLPEEYYYSTSATDGRGITTTTVFNNLHEATKVTSTYDNKTVEEYFYEYNSCSLPIKETFRKYNADATSYIESIIMAEYDGNGNVISEWSTLADGIKNDKYKTSRTYDSTYYEPLVTEYYINDSTKVKIQNTLNSSKKAPDSSYVYVNDELTQKYKYTYGTYGILSSESRYDVSDNSYETISYSYYLAAFVNTIEKDENPDKYLIRKIRTYFDYDNLGRMISYSDHYENTTTYSYDNLGNIVAVTHPDSTSVQYTRDYANNTVTVTDENGASIKYTYTPLGLEYETVDVLTGNVITRKEYDNFSRLIKYSEFKYGSVTEYTYDVFDRLLSETVKQGDTTLAQTLYEYTDAADNGLYNKVKETIVGDNMAPDIVTTEYYDKHGRLVKTGKFFNGTEYFDIYTYDIAGNTTSVLTAADAAKNLPFTAKYEYDEEGRVTKEYNADNQFITNTYNSYGQLVSVTDYAGIPTTYTYNPLDRITGKSIKISYSSTAEYEYMYDAAGNITTELSPVGLAGTAKTRYYYDTQNRIIEIEQLNSNTITYNTEYTYDGVGNVLTVKTNGKTTKYTYDRFGNVLTETDALNRTKSYTYSSLGRLESVTDKNGITTTYAYDALGRITSFTVGSGDDAETYICAYTKTGQIYVQLNNNLIVSYTYDSLGRISTVTEFHFPVLEEYAKKTYTYDLAGNRTGFTLEKDDETVHNITYTYDNLNRLSTVAQNGNVEATYTYDTNGNRASLTLGNGVATTYSYNYANWVTNLVTKNSSGTILSSYSYEYYDCGNVKYKTDNSGKRIEYKYDDLYRLVKEIEKNGLTLSYTYDKSGNRTKLTASGTESYTVDYSYNAVNQLTSEVKTSDGTTETTSYTYDNNGNMLSKTSPEGTQTNTYNKQNQLVSSIAAGITSSYTYTPDGIRFSKTVGNATTEYLLDGGNVIGEVQNDEVTATYLYGTNLLNTSTDDETSYYLFNAHGDVTGITDSAQTVTKTYDYDAYGSEINPSATDTNPFRYCGEYFDKETGTYYLRARYYDPSIGRFTQQDTHWNTGNIIHGDDPAKAYPQTDELGLTQYTYRPNIDAVTQSNNLYVYCANNPVWYCDTAGNVFETVFDIVSLGVSIAEAIDNPKNTEAWVSVFADTVDLIPFVTGVGEVTRAVRIADAVGDAADTIHDTKKVGTITGTLGKESVDSWQAAEKALRESIGDTSKGNKARTFELSPHNRIVDAYNPSTKKIAESKYGYASLNKFIETEINRDVYLRDSGKVNSVEWHFYVSKFTGKGGPSEALKNKLIQNRINVVLH